MREDHLIPLETTSLQTTATKEKIDMAPLKLQGKNPELVPGAMLAEVHVDAEEEFPAELETFLRGSGFEPDPFKVEDGHDFVNHWTGRLYADGQQMQQTANFVRAMVASIAAQAEQHQVELYSESELVRGFVTAAELPTAEYSLEECLNSFLFEPTGQLGGAKADIHVEFADDVDESVRAAFLSHGFYPVTGVDPKDNVAYVVFTLQTETYGQGQRVFNALLKSAMPGFREIALEQKLAMAAAGNCVMPEVIRVS